MIQIKPIMKFKNGQHECHRLMIICVGNTRAEAYHNMWDKYYGNVIKPKAMNKKEKK